MSFTRQELDVLFDAVEKWESIDMTGELLGSIFGSLGGRDRDQHTIDQQKREQEQRLKKMNDEARTRKERGVLIRAKLIQMRDSVDAARLLRSKGDCDVS